MKRYNSDKSSFEQLELKEDEAVINIKKALHSQSSVIMSTCRLCLNRKVRSYRLCKLQEANKDLVVEY